MSEIGAPHGCPLPPMEKSSKISFPLESDKVQIAIMTNNDNLESNLLTSSLLKMCSLVQAELCVYCPVAGDELTLSVLHDLTFQVNLFSRNVIYWLPQFTWKYNGMFLNSHKSRCGRSGV